MNEQPMFSKLDADRILKRAAEIEGSDDAKPLTLQELRSIAREAGFGPQAVEQAIVEAQRAASGATRRPPVQRSGLIVVDLSTTRSVPVEVSSEQLTRAVRLFQPYREGPAQVKLEEHRITWRDRKGMGFAVTSFGGRTEIGVFLSKPLLRRGRWMGWVKSAADRLEALVSIVAAQPQRRAHLLAQLPENQEVSTDSSDNSRGA